MLGKPSILSTKLVSQNERELMKLAGFQFTEKDFISIQYVKVDFLKSKLSDVVLITSKNAIRSLIQYNQVTELNGKDIYCVGDSIGKLLESYQIEVKQSFQNSAELGLFVVSENITKVSILAGNRSRPELPNTLKKHNISFTKEITYNTELTPTKLKERFDAILFFSPSGIESYVSQNEIQQEKVICIGRTTSWAAQAYSKNIYVADNHQVKSVIQKTIDLYQNS